MRQKVLWLICFFLMTLTLVYAENENKLGLITGHGVNLRLQPGLEEAVVGILKRGLIVTVIENQGRWIRVRLKDEQEGWVHQDYISTDVSLVHRRIRMLNEIKELTQYAKQYLGTKYSYGGSSPSGFDCSGYTMFIYQKFGYRLPHSAEGQMRIGEVVTREDLTEGDLVFFSTSGKKARINHVGIYLGWGEFIHASSGRGKVRINSLEDYYYKRRYQGGRRIFGDNFG